ncbi:hypothetical protein ABC855_g3164 [[Candida] zeylanoides]
MVNSIQKVYQSYYNLLPIYMLTSGERLTLHCLLLSFLLFVSFGVFKYLPGQLLFIGSRGYYYLFGP